MRINRFSLALCLFLFVLNAQLYAQLKAAESCDVPFVVTNFDNVLLKDLGPQDLLVRLGTVPITLDGISVDGGPKRVALILDPSRNVPEDEWKLEIGRNGRARNSCGYRCSSSGRERRRSAC